jgi:hypothetical protein
MADPDDLSKGFCKGCDKRLGVYSREGYCHRCAEEVFYGKPERLIPHIPRWIFFAAALMVALWFIAMCGLDMLPQ